MTVYLLADGDRAFARDAVVDLLRTHATQRAVARELGVFPSTLRRYLTRAGIVYQDGRWQAA